MRPYSSGWLSITIQAAVLLALLTWTGGGGGKQRQADESGKPQLQVTLLAPPVLTPIKKIASAPAPVPPKQKCECHYEFQYMDDLDKTYVSSAVGECGAPNETDWKPLEIVPVNQCDDNCMFISGLPNRYGPGRIRKVCK